MICLKVIRKMQEKRVNLVLMTLMTNTKSLMFSLFALNFIVIAIVESSGEYFYMNGWIHGVAILFILASFYLVSSRYRLYDPVLSKLPQMSLLALFAFAVSHTIEFLRMGYGILQVSTDTALLNVVNFHIAALFLMMMGMEFILKTYRQRSNWVLSLFGAAAFMFFIIPAFLIPTNKVLLGSGSLITWIYFAAAGVLLATALVYIIKIGKILPVLRQFASRLATTFILVVIVGGLALFYPLLEQLGLPIFQIVYLLHFILYFAMTFIFLAFLKLPTEQGIYRESK